MDVLSRTFLHASLQGAVGIGVGAILDGVFPRPLPSDLNDAGDALVTLIEVSAQLVANGLATAAVFSALSRLDDSASDPTGAVGLTFGLVNSQPNLTRKAVLLSSYARRVLDIEPPLKIPVRHTQTVPPAGSLPLNKSLETRAQVST